MPRCMASRNSRSVYLPIPVSLSGVMLVEYIVPNGSLNAKPPAYSLPPGAVWQTTQSAAPVIRQRDALAASKGHRTRTAHVPNHAQRDDGTDNDSPDDQSHNHGSHN